MDNTSNVVERLARFLCMLEMLDPDASLGGDGQNFLWKEYADTRVRPMLEEIRSAGYVVVPVEPTKAMLREGAEAVKLYNEQGGVLGVERQAYSAMIAAAEGE